MAGDLRQPPVNAPRWIDAHAHLYHAAPDEVRALLARARESGVCTIVNSGTDLDTSRLVVEQCGRHEGLNGTVGVSPFDAAAVAAGWEARIAGLLDAPRIVGIGEIGLDATSQAYPAIEVQREVFERQLELARVRSVPAVVHSRGAEKPAVDVCTSLGVRAALFHCFTGDIPALESVLDAGYYVSFSGIVTFKNARLTPLVKLTPLDRILIETDTPYLAPAPHRGKPNEPAWVAFVGAAVARIKGISEEELAESIRRNFSALFGARLTAAAIDTKQTPPSCGA